MARASTSEHEGAAVDSGDLKRGIDLAAVARETGRRLVTPEMLADPSSDLPAADLVAVRETYAWIREVILRRVRKSEARTEAVCPFVEPSIDAGLFYLSVGRPRDAADPRAIADEVRLYGDIFRRIQPTEGSLAQLRCIVLVLPTAPGEIILPAVDPKESPVETELLELGIMVGEFFRECPFPATWDPRFFPLQSPIPFYAFRPFIKTDWRLIHRVKPWREIYKRRFGEPAKGDEHKFPANIGWLAGRALARLRQALGADR